LVPDRQQAETIGNGRAAALLFAREGAEVLCVDRRLEAAEATVAEITEAGGKARAFEADISKAEDCARIVEAARQDWSRIDILHNNVGIGGGGDGPAHRLDEQAWDRILNVNLKGMWLTIKAVVPVMREQGRLAPSSMCLRWRRLPAAISSPTRSPRLG
jgi:NAD(P)-dependent dehydrogenase (short-subunit alcohol dehydrogenase family)